MPREVLLRREIAKLRDEIAEAADEDREGLRRRLAQLAATLAVLHRSGG